jgi:hypothetical protein
MAHSKTTVGQIIAQASIGVSLGAFAYYQSFIKDSELSSPSIQAAALLDQETQKVTSADIWELNRPESAKKIPVVEPGEGLTKSSKQ